METTATRQVVGSRSTALLREVKSCHDKAYKYVEQGLLADELGNKEMALSFYDQGLQLLDAALNISCEHDEVKRLQDKMRKTKLQIEFRQSEMLSSPPEYEECVASNEPKPQDSSDFADATEIFTVADGAQVFFIAAQGFVSAPSYPSSLHIYKFADNRRPQAFLLVGSWVYPLHPGCSPCLETSYGAFLFPDPSAAPGSAVGVLLPENVGADKREEFQHHLTSLTDLHVQGTVEASAPLTEGPTDQGISAPARPARPPPPSTSTSQSGRSSTEQLDRGSTPQSGHLSETIARGLVNGAEKLTYGLGKGVEISKFLIQKGSEKLKENLAPEKQTFTCDDKYKDGVQKVRYATHCAVRVSGWIVTKLGDATVAIGRQVAPHIKTTCQKYLPKSATTRDSPDGRSTMDNVVEVAAGGLKGFSTVYLGLEQAAKSLLRSLAEETVHVVNHKYGKDAGHLTEHTLFSVGNLALTGYNVDSMGVKAVAKRFAKDTGKALVEEHQADGGGGGAVGGGTVGGGGGGGLLPGPSKEKEKEKESEKQ